MREQSQFGVPVADRQVAEYLVVGAIFFDYVDDVLDFMVEKAVEYKLGARGLRSICEGILTDAMYELPSSKEKVFHLDMKYAQRKFEKSKLSLLKVA